MIEDFHAKSSAEMHFAELASGIRHFKETKKGRGIMCEKVQRYARKYAKQYALDCKIQDIINICRLRLVKLKESQDFTYLNSKPQFIQNT